MVHNFISKFLGCYLGIDQINLKVAIINDRLFLLFFGDFRLKCKESNFSVAVGVVFIVTDAFASLSCEF